MASHKFLNDGTRSGAEPFRRKIAVLLSPTINYTPFRLSCQSQNEQGFEPPDSAQGEPLKLFESELKNDKIVVPNSMKEFDAITYKDGKGDFNNEDENLLISLLKTNQNPKRMLDIGCGDGKLTKRVKDQFPEIEVIAIDNSSDQINMAISEQSTVNFQLADIVNYSPESKFDCAYSFYAFPHIPKSKLLAALKSVKRSLEKEGVFYLFTNICLFDTSKATPEDQEACDIVFLNNWPSQINLVDMDEMKKIITDAGFKIIQDKRLETGAKIKDYGDMISWAFILR